MVMVDEHTAGFVYIAVNVIYAYNQRMCKEVRKLGPFLRTTIVGGFTVQLMGIHLLFGETDVHDAGNFI